MKRQLDVIYVLNHGFSVRMVLQTGLLDSLSKSGLKVGVICPDVNDEILNRLNRVEIIGFNFHPSLVHRLFLKIRPFLMEDIEANSALYDKFEVLKRNSHDSFINRALLKLVILIRRSNLNSTKAFINYVDSYLLRVSKAKKILKELSPKLLVATYPVNTNEAILLKAARINGIPTCLHLLSWDNITCKGKFREQADYYISWGEIMTGELKEFYDVKDEFIYTTGVPHFDIHFNNRYRNVDNEVLENLGIVPKTPYIFFAMSSPVFAPREIDIIEEIARQIEASHYGVGVKLVVRPHPQNIMGNMADITWLERLNSLKSENVIIYYPDVREGGLAWSMSMQDMDIMSIILSKAALTINSGSTMILDSFCVDVPVVLSSFDGNMDLPYWRSSKRLIDFPHLKKIISYKALPVATSFTELDCYIIKMLEDNMFLHKERENTLRKWCYNVDSKSTLRVVDALKSIVVKSKSL